MDQIYKIICRVDLILLSETSNNREKGKFDLYVDGKLYYDSDTNGAPGPTVVEPLIKLVKLKLEK